MRMGASGAWVQAHGIGARSMHKCCLGVCSVVLKLISAMFLCLKRECVFNRAWMALASQARMDNYTTWPLIGDFLRAT